MEEHFILRLPESVAERINRILSEDPQAGDDILDLSFQDPRSATFTIGAESFPASLLDLPCVVESYKTYDDNVLIKTADIGQMILVREQGEPAPEGPEYKHGLTPVMRDARRRRFRREPDLNLGGEELDSEELDGEERERIRKPESEWDVWDFFEECVRERPDLVQQVENDLQNIMAGGTARDVDVEVVEQEADDDDDNEAEEPAPRTTAASKKSKAATAAASATAAGDEALGDGDGDGDDEFDDMDEDDEED